MTSGFDDFELVQARDAFIDAPHLTIVVLIQLPRVSAVRTRQTTIANTDTVLVRATAAIEEIEESCRKLR